MSPFDGHNAHAIQVEVGSLLRRLRSRLGITQTEVASLTGIHRTYLSRVERGVVVPSVMALLKALYALKVDKIMLRVRG